MYGDTSQFIKNRYCTCHCGATFKLTEVEEIDRDVCGIKVKIRVCPHCKHEGWTANAVLPKLIKYDNAYSE